MSIVLADQDTRFISISLSIMVITALREITILYGNEVDGRRSEKSLVCMPRGMGERPALFFSLRSARRSRSVGPLRCTVKLFAMVFKPRETGECK